MDPQKKLAEIRKRKPATAAQKAIIQKRSRPKVRYDPIPDKAPKDLTFEPTRKWLRMAHVDIEFVDDAMVLHGDAPEWLAVAAQSHADVFQALSAWERAFRRIEDATAILRVQNAWTGATRQEACDKIQDQIEALTTECFRLYHSRDGYSDALDLFEDGCQIQTLRLLFAELTAPGNPYPLPPGDTRPRDVLNRLTGQPTRKWFTYPHSWGVHIRP